MTPHWFPRFLYSAAVLFPALARAKFGSARVRERAPKSLRRAFERLGPVWVKLAQWLSLRFDLLPDDYCRALLEVDAAAKPLPFAVIREVFSREIARLPEEVFDEIETKPDVSTVLHQLHRAKSARHGPVLVKIQRPQIENVVAVDAQVLRALARLIDFTRLLQPYSARTLLKEFLETLNSEVDYRVPARVIRRRQEFAAADGNEVSVKVVPQLSRRRVLTTQLIDGTMLIDILRAVQTDETATLGQLTADGYDLETIGRRIYRNTLNQVYRDGLFHADLTPASMMVLPGNVIAYVDFGMMGRLSEEQMDGCRFLICSLFAGQVDRAVDEFARRTVPSGSTHIGRFREEVGRVFEDYLDSLASKLGSIPRSAAANFIIDLMGVARRHRVVIPDTYSLYLRAVLTTDTIVLELAPGLDVAQEAGRFFLKASLHDAKQSMAPMNAIRNFAEATSSLGQVLRDLNNIQQSSSSLEISLRTLKVRLFEYGISAAVVAGAAYITYTSEYVKALGDALGIRSGWLSGALFAGAALLLTMMWRQGRDLRAIDRTSLSRTDVLARSRGRVR